MHNLEQYGGMPLHQQKGFVYNYQLSNWQLTLYKYNCLIKLAITFMPAVM